MKNLMYFIIVIAFGIAIGILLSEAIIYVTNKLTEP